MQEAVIELAAQRELPQDDVAWRYGAVRHKAISAAQSQRRPQAAGRPGGRRSNGELLALPEQADEARLAAAALESLPQQQRELVVADIWGGLPFPTNRPSHGYLRQHRASTIPRVAGRHPQEVEFTMSEEPVNEDPDEVEAILRSLDSGGQQAGFFRGDVFGRPGRPPRQGNLRRRAAVSPGFGRARRSHRCWRP